MKFTIKEYLSKTDAKRVNSVISYNIYALILRLNALNYGPPKIFTSTLRSMKKQRELYKGKVVPLGSCHLTGEAADIEDSNGNLKRWLMEDNCKRLIEVDLYMEDPLDSPTWCHLQTRPPKSGKRVFRA